jgi:large subunit ribosomal protein L32
MQSAIQEELGLSPVEQEVVVLYEGEKVEQPAEYWKVNREAKFILESAMSHYCTM